MNAFGAPMSCFEPLGHDHSPADGTRNEKTKPRSFRWQVILSTRCGFLSGCHLLFFLFGVGEGDWGIIPVVIIFVGLPGIMFACASFLWLRPRWGVAVPLMFLGIVLSSLFLPACSQATP